MRKKQSGIQIKLDWDNICLHEAIMRVSQIMKINTIEEIKLYESCTQKGYHAILGTYFYVNVTFRYNLRQKFKDDGFRLAEDILFKSAYFRDVLFDYKMINGHKLERTEMFKFLRSKYLSDKWQVKNLKTKSFQIYTRKQSQLFQALSL